MLMNSFRSPKQAPTEPNPLETGRVGRDDAVKPGRPLGLLDDVVRVQEFVFLRDPSSFQQNTFLPSSLQRPGSAPVASQRKSPSGRIWPTDTERLARRMPSMMRSMILGCGFIQRRGIVGRTELRGWRVIGKQGQPRLLLRRGFRIGLGSGRQGPLQLLDDAEHLVASDHRVVDDELERRGLT